MSQVHGQLTPRGHRCQRADDGRRGVLEELRRLQGRRVRLLRWPVQRAGRCCARAGEGAESGEQAGSAADVSASVLQAPHYGLIHRRARLDSEATSNSPPVLRRHRALVPGAHRRRERLDNEQPLRGHLTLRRWILHGAPLLRHPRRGQHHVEHQVRSGQMVLKHESQSQSSSLCSTRHLE